MTTLTKQEISDRLDELNDAVMTAAARAEQAAERDEHRKQAAERQALQVQCEATGGHYFGPKGFPRYSCLHCEIDSKAADKTLSANLVKG